MSEIKELHAEQAEQVSGGGAVVEGDRIVLKGYGRDGNYYEMWFSNDINGIQEMHKWAERLGIEI